MDCECCGTQVGGEKNYVIFALQRETRQVAICKACMMLGMRAPSGSIIANKEVVEQPKLAFPFKKQSEEFCRVAREEGWITHSLPGNAVVIDAHYKQALINNYFTGIGWKKDVGKTPIQCFQKSCRNIKENYPQWLALKVGK